MNANAAEQWELEKLPLARIGLYEELDTEKNRCFPYNAGAGGGKDYKWRERKKGCRRDCLTEWQMIF